MSGIQFGFGFPIAESTVPTEVADGAEVSVWFDTFGRMVIKGSNVALEALDFNDVAPAIMETQKVVLAQSTGVGVSVPINVENYHDHTFQIVIAAIGTSVTLRAEGSNDGTSWFNLDDGGADTTYVANGTYLMHKPDFKCEEVRFRHVSEVGAAVTVNVTYFGGN